MQRLITALLSLLILSLTPTSLPAKGRTSKITIKGAGLTTPLEITDPDVTQFGVWEGPGVGINGVEQTEGFIIDWAKGVVAGMPPGLQQYQVLFYAGCETGEYGCRNPEPLLVYSVSYAYDPVRREGFVYLPGRGDEAFRFNRAMWHGHGFEGHWLRAADRWERFARPLIAKARAGAPNR